MRTPLTRHVLAVAAAAVLACSSDPSPTPAEELECETPPEQGDPCSFECTCAEGLYCQFKECAGADCKGDVGVCGEEQV